MTLNPDIVNLSGRVDIHQEPLWEVPMDALPPVPPMIFYELIYAPSVPNDEALTVYSEFVGDF